MSQPLAQIDRLLFAELGKVAAPFENKLHVDAALFRLAVFVFILFKLPGLDLKLAIQSDNLPAFQNVSHVHQLVVQTIVRTLQFIQSRPHRL